MLIDAARKVGATARLFGSDLLNWLTTSIWVDHLRKGDLPLRTALEVGQVLTHPFVIGELACGNLKNRAEVLGLLRQFPSAPVATDLHFQERQGRDRQAVAFGSIRGRIRA
jgi:predicted nucleic acid-binding protein